mmetsp:Transcript_25481/g.73135  ORF Transcript_25481/g.73135 Transcript_25481/m.73135 type:complete len:117 (-) Transcript_25481:735-1085(-)
MYRQHQAVSVWPNSHTLPDKPANNSMQDLSTTFEVWPVSWTIVDKQFAVRGYIFRCPEVGNIPQLTNFHVYVGTLSFCARSIDKSRGIALNEKLPIDTKRWLQEVRASLSIIVSPL